MYGSQQDIRHNLRLFFIDGMLFMPALTLLSIATVIPFFLEKLGASTIQIGMAASLALICTLITQPLFGSISSKVKSLSKTFGKILLIQRVIFLLFILSIPLLSDNNALLIWMFLIFWGIFNFFVGSYGVFYTPLVLKLLPPDKRGMIRGMGNAIGSLLGMGAAALIPPVLSFIPYPYNFMTIFIAGVIFLLIDAMIYFFMRENGDTEPFIPMSVIKYLKAMPSTIRDNPAFRALIITCTSLIAANTLLPYYTLYGIRVFQATESHIATLAALAVISNAVGFIVFGASIDRQGPVKTVAIGAILVISAGVIALTTNTLFLLFVAWIFANLGVTSYHISMGLIIGEVNPSGELPLYVGVLTVISGGFSSLALMGLAPILERAGFTILFITVITCASISLLANFFMLRKRIKAQST